MKLAVAAVLVTMLAHDSLASCGYVAPKPARIVVDTCTPVDPTKLNSPGRPTSYEGLLVEGTLTVGKDAPGKAKVWVPASENLVCAQLKQKATITGTLAFACCDGDPNPPCLIQTSSILTKLTIDSVKPVKQATRAELEAEVERLRVENATLRAKVDDLLARETARVKLLQQQLEAGSKE